MTNLDNIAELGIYDLKALADCINLYLQQVPMDEKYIDAAGYNSQSGYIWFYLACGVEVVAGFGSCFFQIFDHETGEEHHADTWAEIMEIQNETKEVEQKIAQRALVKKFEDFVKDEENKLNARQDD